MSSVTNSTIRKPLKVYILAGQSNMLGHAHVRTLPYVGMDPYTAPLLEKIQTTDESFKSTFKTYDNVWISQIGGRSPEQERHGNLSVGCGANEHKIGPELMFGITMHEVQPDKDILIIKTSWGGKSLHTDFRPPNAGPYEFKDQEVKQLDASNKLAEKQEEKRKASGRFYRLMMKHIRRVLDDIPRIVPTYTDQQGYELAGFVWFQGFNDVVDRGVYPKRDQPGGYDEYGRLLSLFIQNVRNDLSMPSLPFVIGVIGVGGVGACNLHQSFRKAMEIPLHRDKMNDVVAVRTEHFWDQEIQDIEQKLGNLTKKMKRYKANIAKDMTPQEEQELMKGWKQELCTPNELKILALAKSDGGYHYNGSAKFFLRAGKAFAEALHNVAS